MTPNEVIARVKNLPAVSHAVVKLITLLNRPAVSNAEVVLVLTYDNVLTAKLLRACNSPLFGFAERISSVEQAVLVLGHEQILRMVLAFAFGDVMSPSLSGYAIEARGLWLHSLTAAVAAEQLVKRGCLAEADPPTAFTAGLLHDFGKLALNPVLDAGAQSAIRNCIAQKRLSRNAAEKEILGTNHAEVGACLLESWNLPAEIVEAVANHHQPVTEPAPQLSAVIHVSDCLLQLNGAGADWSTYAALADAKVNRALDFTPEKLNSVVAEVHEAARQVARFMDLG